MSAPTILRLKEVSRRVGLGRSMLYALHKPKKDEPKLFPSPIRVGFGDNGAVGWVESEVDAWIAAKIRGAGKDEIAALVTKLEAQRQAADAAAA